MNTDSKLYASVFDSRDQESLGRFLAKVGRELYLYRFALRNFVFNTLRTRYRRSVLGFLWSLLNPFFSMMVMAVVFSVVFRLEFKNFSMYVFSGLIPWSYISACLIGGTQALINAEGFLKKVYVPKIIFPMMVVTVETVNLFFSVVSMSLLALLFGAPISWHIVLLPLAIVIAFLFNLGLVLIVSIVTIYFRDLTHILTVVLQALFYLVPIVYPLDVFPESTRRLFLLNPFYYFINLFRKTIYSQEAMVWQDWLIPLALAVVSLSIGIVILKAQDREVVYRL